MVFFLEKKFNFIFVLVVLFFVFFLTSVFADPGSISSVKLNSSYGTNYTNENLTATPIGLSGNTTAVKFIYNWFLNGTSLSLLNLVMEGGALGFGGSVKDYSGFGNNASVSGATFSSTGGYDGRGAYLFDGLNDSLIINDSASLGFLQDFTINFWVKPTYFFNSIVNTSRQILFDKGNFKIYLDDTDGKMKMSFTNTSAIGFPNLTRIYDGSLDDVHSLAVYEDKLFAGFGNDDLEGDIYVYDGSSWSLSFDSAYRTVGDLKVYNGSLYAGFGSAGGQGYIYVYNGTSWGLNYDGPQERFFALEVYNGSLYAGQGISGGDGDVYVYNGTNGTGWSRIYDTLVDTVESMTVYNGKLYVGFGNDAGEGDVYSFDGSTWTLIFDGDLFVVPSMTEYDGNLYFAEGGEVDGDGNIYVYNETSGYALSYDGTNSRRFSALYSYDGKLYAGGGGSSGHGDIYVFDGSTWSQLYNGDRAEFYAFAEYRGDLYAGQGSANGDGDVFVIESGDLVSTTQTNWEGYNFITIVKNSSNVSLYVNGSHQSSYTLPYSLYDSLNNLLIGKGFGGNYFRGLIDDVLIYNRSLTENQIFSLYNGRNYFWSANETIPGDNYTVSVLPNDNSMDGSVVLSNSLLVLDGVGVPPEPSEDGCEYSGSGDWIIDIGEIDGNYCYIETSYDIGGNDIFFFGTGRIDLKKPFNYGRFTLNGSDANNRLYVRILE